MAIAKFFRQEKSEPRLRLAFLKFTAVTSVLQENNFYRGNPVIYKRLRT